MAQPPEVNGEPFRTFFSCLLLGGNFTRRPSFGFSFFSLFSEIVVGPAKDLEATVKAIVVVDMHYSVTEEQRYVISFAKPVVSVLYALYFRVFVFKTFCSFPSLRQSVARSLSGRPLGTLPIIFYSDYNWKFCGICPMDLSPKEISRSIPSIFFFLVLCALDFLPRLLENLRSRSIVLDYDSRCFYSFPSE